MRFPRVSCFVLLIVSALLLPSVFAASLSELSFIKDSPVDSVNRITNATMGEQFAVYGNVESPPLNHYVKLVANWTCFFNNTQPDPWSGGRYATGSPGNGILLKAFDARYNVSHNFDFRSFSCQATGSYRFVAYLLDSNMTVIGSPVERWITIAPPQGTCIDTDGKNYSVKTSVTSSRGYLWWDQCSLEINGTSYTSDACSGENCYLYEQLCEPAQGSEVVKSDRTFDGVYNAKVRCPNGCRDGTCMLSGEGSGPALLLTGLDREIVFDAAGSPHQLYAMEYTHIVAKVRNIGSTTISKDAMLANIPAIWAQDFNALESAMYVTNGGYWNPETETSGLRPGKDAQVWVIGYFKYPGAKTATARIAQSSANSSQLSANIDVMADPGCYDSDGNNTSVRGWAIGSTDCVNQSACITTTRAEDICSDSRNLNEFVCLPDSSGVMRKYVTFIQCPSACANGACMASANNQTNWTCVDTDGGLNYTVAGNAYLDFGTYQTTPINDCCTDRIGSGCFNSSTYLWEAGCGPGSAGYREVHYCPDGCINGACVTSNQSYEYPDFIVTNAHVEPAGLLNYMEPVKVYVTIKNVGSSATQTFLVCVDSDYIVNGHNATYVAGLGTGEEKTIIFQSPVYPGNFAAKATGPVDVWVDCGGALKTSQIFESNEGNNRYSFTINVSTENASRNYCTDSDNNNPYAKGITNASNLARGSEEDVCNEWPNSLREFYCDVDNTATERRVECSAGCENGACTIEGNCPEGCYCTQSVITCNVTQPGNGAEPIECPEDCQCTNGTITCTPGEVGGEEGCVMGCKLEGVCVIHGTKATVGNESKYCGSDGIWVVQKTDGNPCSQNAECVSGICVNSMCGMPCEGCREDICLPYGTRTGSRYCSLNKTLEAQHADSSACENNYECKTNLCIDEKCISKGIWQAFIEWISKLFGGGDSDEKKCTDAGGKWATPAKKCCVAGTDWCQGAGSCSSGKWYSNHCGDGVCDCSETTNTCKKDCSIACNRDSDCDDGNTCTTDKCRSAGTVNSRCTNTAKTCTSCDSVCCPGLCPVGSDCSIKNERYYSMECKSCETGKLASLCGYNQICQPGTPGKCVDKP